IKLLHFFFQAEDGIRDRNVTGVQTYALPIYIRPTLPRHRQFNPLRAEARQAAELLDQVPAEQWTLAALAARVHLSPSQLSRVFTEAYGKTPLTYLTMVRAERLAKSLRETNLPIEAAMRQVGWHSRGHAA